MKKILLIIGFLLVATAISVAFPCYNHLFAVDGCCKDRGSLTGRWLKNNKSYEACNSDNKQKDTDDLFQPTGLVWWDIRCR